MGLLAYQCGLEIAPSGLQSVRVICRHEWRLELGCAVVLRDVEEDAEWACVDKRRPNRDPDRATALRRNHLHRDVLALPEEAARYCPRPEV